MQSPIVLLAKKVLDSSTCHPQRPKEFPRLSQEVRGQTRVPGFVAEKTFRANPYITGELRICFFNLSRSWASTWVCVPSGSQIIPFVMSSHTLLWALGIKLRSPVLGGKHLYHWEFRWRGFNTGLEHRGKGIEVLRERKTH